MTDFTKGERIYQEFIEFRDKFLSSAMKEASAHSTNSNGEKFRPIVVVPERKAEYWKNQIKQWNAYAEELRKYPELGIPLSLYEPEPKYISGANRIRCYELPATNTSTSTREKVIADIKAMIERVSGIEDTNGFVKKLEGELAMMTALPPKTKLRTRRTGYSDLSCSYNTVEEKKIMVRATASGLFFDDRVLRYGFQFGPKATAERRSVYDEVQPLPLTIYKNMDVYLFDEVEKARAEMKAYREANAEQIKRDQWARANSKRRGHNATEEATKKRAAKSVGELDPAGKTQE
ncbi:hypothetical protein [Pantoea sp. CCBC3-3-1]|uniref:hypothetical protein n=1 Tax=Pantoea sp. CCBC3-3-1 TaxID=2490851 RepID=UPI0011BDB4A9|nr:hypothetical protein [Pantoea sp. CCBC3-3-1]